MKNKKGNIFWGITIGFFLFAMGVLIIPFITDDITTARTGLDCSNSTISDGTKFTCLQHDLVVPYLIWFFVSIAIGYFMGVNK